MEKKIIERDRKEYQRLGISFLILLVILGGFALYLSWPLLNGKKIILATLPIDPFDPLRGQYITINYEISTIPSLQKISDGETIYVILKKDNEGTYRYYSDSFSLPKDSTFIRGKYSNGRIDYGIEQYFFERNAKIPTQNITVEVRVDSTGQARIVQLLQNKQPLNIEYKKKFFD